MKKLLAAFIFIFSLSAVQAGLVSGSRHSASENFRLRSRVGRSGVGSALMRRWLVLQQAGNSSGVDADNDGLDDSWEWKYFGSISAQDGAGDYDLDGLTNLQEYELYHTNPKLKDSDKDGMEDHWEAMYGLDPADETDADSDTDGDGIPAWLEAKNGLDPTVNDTESQPEMITVTLKKGWNMVAVPFKSETKTYADIFLEVPLGNIWIWDSENQYYSQGDEFYLSPTQGAWIYSEGEIVVPLLND